MATYSSWTVKNLGVILFSSFSFTSSANTVNSYPQINSESRPFSLPWLLTTPEQATMVSHQDTCGHLLSCLCASSLLFYGLLLTPHKSEQCHITLLLKTLLFCWKPSASHFTPRNFPAALHPSRQQLPLCPHCLLFSHLSHTTPVTPDSSLGFRHAPEPLHLLSPLPGMFSPLPHTCWLTLFKYPLIREKPSLRTLHEMATHPVSSLPLPFTCLCKSS